MNQDDKEKIIDRYRRRYQEFGEDIRALASGNRERQQIRFELFAAIGALNNRSILDIGCGFGDFYGYLQARNIAVDYTGIDICPEFIARCREKYPDANFAVKDIQVDSFDRRFDYIIASQTFNNPLEQEDNYQVVKDVIGRAYDLADEGVAIDFISSYVDFRIPQLFYYDPKIVFDYCKQITKRVLLRHDYPLFEFTVILYKDFAGWNKAAS